MIVGFDTNILLYAEGIDTPDRQLTVGTLLDQLRRKDIVIPVQVLGELFAVLVRKVGRSRSEARETQSNWRDGFTVAATTPEVMDTAADLATEHQLLIWDAIVLASAASASCRILLTEDRHHGFTWAGVTLVNPFESPLHPLLERALAE